MPERCQQPCLLCRLSTTTTTTGHPAAKLKHPTTHLRDRHLERCPAAPPADPPAPPMPLQKLLGREEPAGRAAEGTLLYTIRSTGASRRQPLHLLASMLLHSLASMGLNFTPQAPLHLTTANTHTQPHTPPGLEPASASPSSASSARDSSLMSSGKSLSSLSASVQAGGDMHNGGVKHTRAGGSGAASWPMQSVKPWLVAGQHVTGQKFAQLAEHEGQPREAL